MTASSPPPALPWRENPGHRRWLRAEADALFAFFEPDPIDPAGGFHSLDSSRAPVGGGDGAAAACDDEARALFRDRASLGAARRGGFRRPRDARTADPASRRPLGRLFLVVRPRRPARARQARLWPRLRAARRLERQMRGPSRRGPRCSPISPKCWRRGSGSPARGASAEEFREDWTPFSDYRGQNANMHLTEALMAAFEATGERSYLDKAERIADLILRRNAGRRGLARARALPRRLERSIATTRAPTCSAPTA